MTSLEQEVKLIARKPLPLPVLADALARLGLATGPAEHVHVRDLYLDTPDFWFYRAGVACRLRIRAGRTSLGLKTLTPSRRGFAARTELEEVLARPPPEPLTRLPGRTLAARCRRLTGSSAIRILFEIEQQRVVLEARAPDGLRVAVSADSCRIGKSARPFHELELELCAGLDADLRRLGKRLRKQLRLKTGRCSKFERGLAALRIAVPPPPPVLPRLTADMDFGPAVYRILQSQYDLFTWNLPGTLLGLDPERLHELRVAARRTAAVLQIVAFVLPGTVVRYFRRELKWISRHLGRVRDLDIFLQQIESVADHAPPHYREALSSCAAEGRQAHEAEHRLLVKALRSRRTQRFVERFERFLAAGEFTHAQQDMAHTPLALVAPELVRRSLRKTIRKGRQITADSPAPELHALRRRCRKLRYLGEFFRELYGRPMARLVRRVTNCQALLGARQDAVVVQDKLREFRDKQVPDTTRRAAFDQALQLLMGQLIRLQPSRHSFEKAWSRLDRKKVYRRAVRSLRI